MKHEGGRVREGKKKERPEERNTAPGVVRTHDCLLKRQMHYHCATEATCLEVVLTKSIIKTNTTNAKSLSDGDTQYFGKCTTAVLQRLDLQAFI
ncbi:unnamed protein product, partial [Dovyalis caffra]